MKIYPQNILSNMNKLLVVILLLLQSAEAFAASEGICSTASLINPSMVNGGMGGTGMPENGGMGGTGISTEHGEQGGDSSPIAQKGMGGTGISVAEHNLLPENSDGGIAIIGVITGFASICVDGVEVHYATDTPIFENGKVAKLAHMAAGKMVMLKAERVGGQLQARAIGMFDAVAGPVGRIDMARQQLEVMGQTVRVDKNTLQQMQGTTAGTSVRVSGHRLENGEIIATRVDVSNHNASVSTMGVVTSISRGSIEINGTRVNVSDSKILSDINVGSEVRVSGSWDGKVINSSRLEAQPIKNMINRADKAIVEGYLGAKGVNQFNLYGTELVFANGRQGESGLSASKLVKIEMRREKDGHWIADKVEARESKFFEKDIQFKDEKKSNDSSASKSKDGDRVEQKKSESSSSRSNSGSGSSSGSSSGSGSSPVSDRSSSSGSSRNRNNESSDRGSSSRSSGGGSSSGSGSSGKSGSGKYK